MIKKTINFLKLFRDVVYKSNSFLAKDDLILHKITFGLARAAASAAARNIDSTSPTSWGFSGFSQSNEDGIIDYLTRKILNPNCYFIEIGAANGLENNTAWLALARKFSGIMIDGGDSILSNENKLSPFLIGNVDFEKLFVTVENIQMIMNKSQFLNPDVLSIDIDGNDYYIAEKILELGYKPKIFVVEYNAVFGPDKSITIPYTPDFCLSPDHKSLDHFYHGVSISAWRVLLEKNGYKFVTVEENGVNAFFVNPLEFDNDFIRSVKSLHFRDNYYQVSNFRMSWKERFNNISDKDFYTVI